MSIEQAIDTIASEAEGFVILAVGKNGEIHSQQNKANLVIPLVSSQTKSLQPMEIIAAISAIETLQMKTTRKTTAPGRKASRKQTAPRTAAKNDQTVADAQTDQ